MTAGEQGTDTRTVGGGGDAGAAAVPAVPQGSPLEVFPVFLRLGLTSFGGPIAHLGYFREEIVVRRKWIDDASFADLLALCQFLPGPASSQLGISLGMARAGVLGGLMAWLGFTMPSALLMLLIGLGVASLGDLSQGVDVLHGLKVVAVAVVAQAVWGLATRLCPDRTRITFAIVAAVAMLLVSTPLAQIAVIAIAGFIGWRILPDDRDYRPFAMNMGIPRPLTYVSIVLFFGLLFGMPLALQFFPSQALALFEAFYRAGSLVFGGGHVVLPLLQASVVDTGWVTNEAFLAGYGAAQAMPGPLFTFSAFLGAVSTVPPNGVLGSFIALFGIFLPSFFMLFAVLPFWDTLRTTPGVQAALRGINAAVVGILLAALYNPVWTAAIFDGVDFALALVAFLLLMFWKTPPWLVVVLGGLAGAAIEFLPAVSG